MFAVDWRIDLSFQLYGQIQQTINEFSYIAKKISVDIAKNIKAYFLGKKIKLSSVEI